MKKLLIFLFVLCFQTAKSQVYQLMPQYGYDTKRMNFDSTLSIPTFCGVPSLKSNVTKKAAIAYDSCNKRFYYYDPKLMAWDTIKGGGTSSIDTTSISNRINQRIDSLRRSGDSVFAKKNGSWVFQYKDSIGGANGFVPYTGATQDVDLGNNGLTAKFIKVTGTGGNGHIDFKHQSADATAQGNSTVLFANSSGYLKWKNDNLYYSTLATPQTADRVFTTQDKSYTLGDSADIAVRVKYTDTATMLNPYQTKYSTDTMRTNIYNTLNGKLNISDTSTMLSKYLRRSDTTSMLLPYLRKTDTSTLSSRINLRLLISDTSTMLTPYLRKTDTTAMLNPYQRKYASAYSMNVNNTNAGANTTETTYKQFASATYSGTATWTGTTAPSGTTNHTYSWNQVGKLVTLRINLIYGTAGSLLTQVSCTLPSDCPTPEEPAGIGAANDVISYGSGVLTTSLAATGLATVAMGYSALRVNSADNGYDIVIARNTINARYAYATIQYFAQ